MIQLPFVLVACFVLGGIQGTSSGTSDGKSVESLCTALYEVISGPGGQKRDWNRMRSLFTPEAKMAAMAKRASGETIRRILTVEDYVQSASPYFEKNGFFEKEIAHRTEIFGSMAHVWSTYESRYKANDPNPFERGINSIELWNDGKRWWITNIEWQGEEGDLKLPGKYLKSGG